MIRTPSYEDESLFIVLDAFQPYDSICHSYLIGCKLYMHKSMVERSRRGEEVLYPILRERGYDGINRSKEDIFEIPTIREYTRFMNYYRKKDMFGIRRKVH